MATGNLTYVTGTKEGTYWVRVGHNTSVYNNDAVWSFTPPTANGLEKYTSVTFRLTWNCTESTGGPNSGWQGEYSYVFAVSTSGDSGRTAASGTHLKKTTVNLSGYTGATDITVSGLSLTPGTTYYLRANMNGTTYKTMKAFYLANAKAVSDQSISGITDPGVTWNATEQYYQLTVKYNANGGSITTGTGTTRYRVSSNIVQRSQDSGATWADLAPSNRSQGNWDLNNVTSSSYDGGVKKTGYHVVSTQEFNTKADGTGNNINQQNGDTNAATIYRMNGNAYLTANKTISLYVNWVIDTYTIAYNANGHGTAPSSQTKTYGTTLTLQPFISNVNGTTSTVTITGDNRNGDSWTGSNGSATWRPVYSQNNWNTKSDGSGTNYGSAASYTANAAATMYAQWTTTNTGLTYVLPTGTPTKNNTTANTLTVSYNANGGDSTPAYQTSSKTVTYSFKGWYTAVSGGTKRTTSSRVTAAETVYSQFDSTQGAQASITLRGAITHANTTPTTYTVTFNANSGSSTKTSQSAAVTRTWTFNGWHEGSASGTSHAASSSFTPSANVTMYAGWNTSDSTASVTLPTAAQCTRTGYTLLGFSTSSTATTATYAPGATYTPSASIILYAVWKANTYTHVYLNGRWKPAPVYIYQGGSWKEISTVIKIYNGTKWTKV